MLPFFCRQLRTAFDCFLMGKKTVHCFNLLLNFKVGKAGTFSFGTSSCYCYNFIGASQATMKMSKDFFRCPCDNHLR